MNKEIQLHLIKTVNLFSNLTPLMMLVSTHANRVLRRQLI